MKELRTMSETELLQTHSGVITELRRRDVVKTENNPIGDYTEWLVCNRLMLQGQGSSKEAFDAIDAQGIRYQIKGRRSSANSVQFSTIRNLQQHGFDFVIAIIFDEDYSVRLAVKIAYNAVPKLARYQAHVNGHNLILTSKAVEEDGIEDISHLISRPTRGMPAAQRPRDASAETPRPRQTHQSWSNIRKAARSLLGPIRANPVTPRGAIPEKMKAIRTQSHQSWSNIRKAARNLQGLGHEPFGTPNVENSAKSCVRKIHREVGLSFAEIESLVNE